MNRHRSGKPVWLDDLNGMPIALDRLSGSAWSKAASDEKATELSLQRLLADSPEILPFSEFSSVFAPAACIAREAQTDAGPIDLLFMSDQGRLIIGETKLHKNPESRRKVLAQVQDYTDQVTRWSYADVDDRAKAWYKKTVEAGAPPWPGLAKHLIARFPAGADESTWESDELAEEIERNLERREFLVLIISDEIRANTISLVEFANRHSSSRIEYGLVELAFFRRANTTGPLIVVPRVVSRTSIVERVVVVVQDAEGRPVPASISRVTESDAVRAYGRKPQLASREAFLHRASGKVAPETLACVGKILDTFDAIAAESDGLYEVGFAGTTCGFYWRQAESQTRRFLGVNDEGAFIVRTTYLKSAGAEAARTELTKLANTVLPVDPEKGGTIGLTVMNVDAVVNLIKTVITCLTPMLRALSDGI